MQKSTRAVQEISDTESDFENIDLSDIEDKSDESVSNDSKPKYIPADQEISFAKRICVPETGYKKEIKKITKEKFDRYDFSQTPFIEQIIHYKDQPLYVHPFFDIDDIEDTDEYKKLIEWVDSLKPVFGDYSIGGYCNNDEMAAFGYKLIATATKYASLHISFYQTAIDADEMQLICKKSTKGLHPMIDEKVYKIQNPTKKDTQKQGMRFVLSNKIYGKKGMEDVEAAGNILGEKLPHTCTYQVWGGERIVSREEWSKIFTIAEEEKPKKKTRKTRKANVGCDKAENDFSADQTYVVPVDEEVVLELLNEFEPTHTQLEQIGCSLMQSPFDKETVRELLKKWYFQEGTKHHNLDTVDGYVDKYYKREYTNRWLFSIIKKIPDPVKREEWYREFKNEGIDPDIEINMKDQFTFVDITNGNYKREGGSGVDAVRFMNDLKRVCVKFQMDNEVCIALKSLDNVNNTIKLCFMSEKHFIKTFLENLPLGGYYKNGVWKNVNAFMVYSWDTNRQTLNRDGVKFYSEKPKIFNVFQGYDYEELDDYDEEIISPFLTHIRENIATGNEELYNYILNWISFILQNPAKKTGTVLVLTGEQGTGKNTFTEIICDLMKQYSVRNLTDFCELVGKFNSVIENKKLIICNEMSSTDSNKRLNFNALKSLITDDQARVGDKFEPKRTIQNVANFIVLSNFFDPVKVEGGDRRYCVCEVSEEHKDDRTYFAPIRDGCTEEFYQNLFTFFMKRDVKGVDFTKIPHTEIRQALMESSRSSYELFIQDFIKDFKKGFKTDKAYEYYKMWAYINGFSSKKKFVAAPVFGKNIAKYVDVKRHREEGGRVRRYHLKESKDHHFEDVYENDEEYKEFKNDVRKTYNNEKY